MTKSMMTRMKTAFSDSIPLLVKALIVLSVSSSMQVAQAQWDDGSVQRTTDDSKRSYFGGSDEEDLQVQAEVTEPPIKITEQMLQNQVLEEMKRDTSSSRPNSASGRE